MKNFEAIIAMITGVVGIMAAINAMTHLEFDSRVAKLRPNATNPISTLAKVAYVLLLVSGMLLFVLGITYGIQTFMAGHFEDISGLFIATGLGAVVFGILIVIHDTSIDDVFFEQDHIIFHIIKVTDKKVYFQELFPDAHPLFSANLDSDESVIQQNDLDFLDGRDIVTFNHRTLTKDQKHSTYMLVSKRFSDLHS